jgi:tetratricopeptide (TPR) repeat protein
MKFAREASSVPALKAALDQVVLCSIDGEKGDGPSLEKQNEVKGHPTFIVLNADGAAVGRWSGYSKSDQYIESLNAAVKDPTTFEQKHARFQSKPTAEDAEKLAAFHDSRRETKDAVRFYNEAQKLGAGPGKDYRFAIFEATAGGAFEGDMTLAETKQTADAALAYNGRTVDQVMEVAGIMTVLGRKEQDREVMVPYLKLAMQESAKSQDEDVQKTRKRLESYNALYVDKNEAKAIALRKETLGEDWQQDPEKLNAFAWWCFEGRVNLAEAQTLAQKGVDLAKDSKLKAQILDTMAEICNVRNNCKDAVHYSELAVAADPASDHYPKQVERFRKLLAER